MVEDHQQDLYMSYREVHISHKKNSFQIFIKWDKKMQYIMEENKHHHICM